MSNNDISSMEERNEQTLNDIQTIQKIEQDMFNTLESGMANNTISSEDKTTLVSKINDLSQMRINLYKNVNSTYSFYENNVTSASDTLLEQSVAIDIVENEMNEAKKRLDDLEQDKANKLRLVEINTYYGEKYADHANMMKTIVIICIPIIILTILVNKGIIGRRIYAFLIIIIVVCACIFNWQLFLHMFSHNNMNYDEYDWKFNINNLPPVDTTNPTGENPWIIEVPSLQCIGSACCGPKMSYDASSNMCTPIVASSSVTGATSTTATPSNALFSSYATALNNSSHVNYQEVMGGFGGL